MPDVRIKIDTLAKVVDQLNEIVGEFDNATSQSEELEADIGNPFGRSELRDKACEFEERWNDKRGDLKESLDDLRKHVKGVVDGFENWDSETALQFQTNNSIQAPGAPGGSSAPAAV